MLGFNVFPSLWDKAYYYATKHEGNFEEVLKALKGDFESPEEAGLRKDKIIELYETRKKEIEDGK